MHCMTCMTASVATEIEAGYESYGEQHFLCLEKKFWNSLSWPYQACRTINYLSLYLAIVTRAKARVIKSLRVFFVQDLVSHAATSDFDQSLQTLDACDYLRLCDWQFSSHFSGPSHSTSCFSLALKNICNIVCFKVLTCVLNQICVNVLLLGMRVQNKRLYVCWHVYLIKISCPRHRTCPRRTRINQSGLTLSTQIRSNKGAVRFLGI